MLTLQNTDRDSQCVCCQASPFLLAEVRNHVFSCVYKTDLHEFLDTAIEFMGFYRDLSIHFAL